MEELNINFKTKWSQTIKVLIGCFLIMGALYFIASGIVNLKQGFFYLDPSNSTDRETGILDLIKSGFSFLFTIPFIVFGTLTLVNKTNCQKGFGLGVTLLGSYLTINLVYNVFRINYVSLTLYYLLGIAAAFTIGMVIYHSKNYNFARYIALLVLSGIQLYYYLIAGILRDILSTETVVPVFGALTFVLIAVSAIFSILHCKEIKKEVRAQSKPVIDNIVVNDVVEKVVKEAIVTGSDDPVTKLKQLKELYDSGIITSEEYESKKKELLTKI